MSNFCLNSTAPTSERTKTDGIMSGAIRVAVGFLTLADNLTTFINSETDHFENLGLWPRWLIIIAIAFRILLDFSGYSDMAIGFAQMMGVKLPENFNWPYSATSPAEFWRRWHISLSSWIRDYIYIPLAGGRVGQPARRLAFWFITISIGLACRSSPSSIRRSSAVTRPVPHANYHKLWPPRSSWCPLSTRCY